MNRFFKKNLVLLIVTGTTMMAVAVLIYLVVVKHAEMTKYLAETQKLIKDIQALNLHKPSPATENLARINKDTEGYENKLAELQKRFGFPFSIALEKFAREIGFETAEFQERFRSYWVENKRAGITRDQVFRMFRVSLEVSNEQWNRAISEFTHEVRKRTLEQVDANNVEEILMEALGVPRDMSGSVVKCTTFMTGLRDRLISYFRERGVSISPDAASFSFNLTGLPEISQMTAMVKNWNIIGDLARRIADSKVNDLTSFTKGDINGRREGDYVYYRFTVGLYGEFEHIRQFQRSLYDAYQENRVYVVRYIQLEKPGDGVKQLLERGEAGERARRMQTVPGMPGEVQVPRRGMARGGQQAAAPTAPQEEEDENLPFYQRRGYGKPIIGANRFCNAVFEIDYVAYVGKELN